MTKKECAKASAKATRSRQKAARIYKMRADLAKRGKLVVKGNYWPVVVTHV